MSSKALGKSYRKRISLKKLIAMFPDDNTAREWIEAQVWPDGPHCPVCGSFNVQSNIGHKSMTHRCRDCAGRPKFSVKTGTVMQSSKLGYQTWAIAAYLLTTNLKGVSSMKLHRDLEITQKSAWHLAHRLCKAFEAGQCVFSGPVEADETYVGGKEGNKHSKKKKRLGRGAVGKMVVAGIKDRETNKVTARVVPDTSGETLREFIEGCTKEEARVFTDEATAYRGLARPHNTVKHSVGEYVRDQAHTNGIESFWAGLKRGYEGTYHQMSEKHLHRYVSEFSGRHNIRSEDTIDQMAGLARNMVGKRLRYVDLIGAVE